MRIDRRSFTLAGLGIAGTALLPAGLRAQAGDALGAIADATGGRLGVSVFDTGKGWRLRVDSEARYPLCSTFKVPLAAAILARVDSGQLALDRPVRFSQADLLDYAPSVRANLAAGQMTIEALCEAAVVVSDNSAANLLLPQLGGPQGLTRFIRAQGDTLTRLDREEPALNQFKLDDPRDTTTPDAMVGLIQRLLVGDTLAPASRDRLIGWMVASPTGRNRLREGLPAAWRTGDKTGTSGTGQFSDIAITWPTGRKPILIAAYLDAPGLETASGEAALAQVGALVGQLFGRE